MTTTIYLIRHGEAEGNLYRRIHGQYDSLLTPTGHKQLEALEARFRDVPVDAVYSSDLTRARVTARAIYVPKGLRLRPDPRFREIGMGVWEDMPFADVSRFYGEELAMYHKDMSQWQVPGSEAYEQFTGRFLTALREAAEANAGKTICVVAHGGVLMAVNHALFFQGQPTGAAGHSDNTAVSKLEYENGEFRKCYLNDSSHMDPKLISKNLLAQARKTDLWFRPVGADEADLYIRFREDAWRCVYGTSTGFDGPGFWLDACMTRGDSGSGMVFAMLGDQIAGLLQLNPERGARDGAGYIPFFYLKPEFRNQGLGVQLIGQAVSYYRPLGRKRLQLSVSPTNLHALHFYEKNGFVRTGKSAGRFGKLYIMDKDIDLAKYRDDILPRAGKRRFGRK